MAWEDDTNDAGFSPGGIYGHTATYSEDLGCILVFGGLRYTWTISVAWHRARHLVEICIAGSNLTWNAAIFTVQIFVPMRSVFRIRIWVDPYSNRRLDPDTASKIEL